MAFPDHTEGISFSHMGWLQASCSPKQTGTYSHSSQLCFGSKFQIPLGIKSQVRHLNQERWSVKEKGVASKRFKSGNSFVFARVRWSQRYKWGDVPQLLDEIQWGESRPRATEKIWGFSWDRSHRRRITIIGKKKSLHQKAWTCKDLIANLRFWDESNWILTLGEAWRSSAANSHFSMQVCRHNSKYLVFASTMALPPFSEERNVWDEGKEQWHKG